jgi:glycosyltransferase involved in cell wall biosynthesis
MKVFHINHSDMSGGAARAAYRIHKALRNIGINSTLLVNQKLSDDWTVDWNGSLLRKSQNLLSPQIAKIFRSLLKTGNPMLHSAAIVPSSWPKFLNQSKADVVNLHWVGWEMLSVRDISKINKPIVWTFHDMWPFCGAEHLTYEYRWKEGYQKNNRPVYENGFDLNRSTWNRKLRCWKTPFNIVAPSIWMADCVKNSALMGGWPVTVIPNPLNLNIWKPAPKNLARDLLGLPRDVPLLLFGAMGGRVDNNKGFDLLTKALECLRDNNNYFELLIFGESAPKNLPALGFPIHYMGHLNDDISLRLLYSAADLMVVPSRIESFGQTASEAHACGTPVVAFNVGGLRDIIDHKITGYLAKAYDPIDLACGILYILKNNFDCSLGKAARLRAEINFDDNIVAKKYELLYKDVLRNGLI